MIPADVVKKAKRDTAKGVYIIVTPVDLVEQIAAADAALDGDSNDREHDALYEIREWLSNTFEDPGSRGP